LGQKCFVILEFPSSQFPEHETEEECLPSSSLKLTVLHEGG